MILINCHVYSRDVKASRPNWPRGQNFGLGLGLLNLASALRLWPWPRPRPQDSDLGLDLGLKCLASASALASSIWPRLTSLGYSSVCFEIKFSGRHRGFDGVLFNLWPLANADNRWPPDVCAGRSSMVHVIYNSRINIIAICYNIAHAQYRQREERYH